MHSALPTQVGIWHESFALSRYANIFLTIMISLLAGTSISRADGSLAGVSLQIGGETHSATFNEDSTLASLIVPGLGNIYGGHSIDEDGEKLTILDTTYERSHDGTFTKITTDRDSEDEPISGRTNTLTAVGGNIKQRVDPVGAAPTDTLFNAAAAPIAKTYADASGEVYGYHNELLASITLARGGEIALAYSDDGAKDHTGTVWPTMFSGSFTIGSMAEAYGTDRAGRRNFIGDGSGGRALVFHNGRLVNTIYNSGLLQGYEIIPARDTAGRHTGTMLKRFGSTIHTTEKALYGASNQTFDLASSGIIATPQRDGAGNITGYIWSDGGSDTVTQTWQRGPGGRIESATNNVPSAAQFTYLLDPNDPEESFDAFGRRLKSQTAGGTWSYEYGIGGQLTSASHPTLGTFTYAFDAIGRRTDIGGTANSENILNQTTAWTHDQSKTLTIKAHPDARVWFNGVELQNFTGQHQAALTPPGTEGGWVPWETLAVLEGAGDGAGNPPVNPLASPDAKAEKKGAVWVPPTQEAFTFDAAGNRESSAQWDYGWDAKNQLARVRTKNHDTAPQAYDINFTYDSEGRRVQKHVVEYASGVVVSEKIITFVWDGWDLLYERHQLPSGLTLLERKYLWGPDIAGGSAGGAGGLLLIRETKGNTTKNIIPLYDGSVNIIALTDINKNLLAEYVHGPFGERIHATGPLANSNPWRWATKYLDEETGLYYFGHRFYDPITGQWLSRDPLGEGEAMNLYAYCHNDPINKVDVLGLAAVMVTGQEMADSLRVEWLLAELKVAMELPTAPPGWAKSKYTEWGKNFGLFNPYTAEDYNRAGLVIENSGGPSFIALTDAEAAANQSALRLQPPEWNPTHTRALTLGAANTPLNASINQDWLLPTGAGTMGAGFAFRNLRPMLPMLRAGAGTSTIHIRKIGDVTTSPWLADPRASVVRHIETFRDGGSYLVPKSTYENWIKGKALIGRPDGQFITTRSAMDKVLLESGGDLAKVKKKLCIPDHLWNEPLMRIDVDNPLLLNARLPSGLQSGANEMFRWGGYTSGGLPEIIVDPIPAGFFRTIATGIGP